MTFQAPLWLLPAVVLPAGLLVAFAARRRARSRSIETFLGRGSERAGDTTLSVPRRWVALALLLVAAAAVPVALARPTAGHRIVEVPTRGVDLLFAVDTSKSMLATDLQPDRLTRAKLAVQQVARAIPEARVGLLAFSGEAFLQTPLTVDHRVFEESLAALDTDILPQAGTDLEVAVSEAARALQSAGGDRIVVLVSDGEDLQGGVERAAKIAQEAGLTIHALGAGSPQGAALFLTDARGRPVPMLDDAGVPVHTALDEPSLQALAGATSGTYLRLDGPEGGVQALLAGPLAAPAENVSGTSTHRVPVERFQWALALALLVLFVEPWVGDRRGGKLAVRSSVSAASGARRLAAGLALSLAVGSAPLTTAQAGEADGWEAYQAGDYAAAAAVWATDHDEDPSDAKTAFDLGAAAYRAGDFAAAETALTSAVATEDLQLQQSAHYNLGAARFRLGEAALAADDLPETRRWWEASIAAYEAAVDLDPTHGDARVSLEVVRRKLDELPEEPPPEDSSDAQCDNPQPSDDGDQGDQDGDAGDQGAPDGAAGAQDGAAGAQDGDDGDAASPPTDPAQGTDEDGSAAAAGDEDAPGGEDGPQAALSPGGLTGDQAALLLDSLDGYEGLIPLTLTRPGSSRDRKAKKGW